jgi:hypothetical protein
VIGDEIVIVATAGVAPAEADDVRVGQRIPIVPPLGAIFVAWSDPSTVDHWLAVAGGVGLDYVGMDLEPDCDYRVSTIAAPVFGPGGDVAVALTANGLRGSRSGADVAEIAARLVATARSVTKTAHGRPPAGAESDVDA